MAYSAKVPGMGKLEKTTARQCLTGEGGKKQHSAGPQQNPRKLGARGFKGRLGSR